MDLEGMFSTMNKAGARYRISFDKLSYLYNSGPALEASELARDKGVYDKMHNLLFKAYFNELKDISKREVLFDMALQVGIDPGELNDALDDGRYKKRLADTTTECRELGISAVPAFIIDGSTPIIGAQPLDVFRAALSGATHQGKTIFTNQ